MKYPSLKAWLSKLWYIHTECNKAVKKNKLNLYMLIHSLKKKDCVSTTCQILFLALETQQKMSRVSLLKQKE